jgi:hypothetical protein
MSAFSHGREELRSRAFAFGGWQRWGGACEWQQLQGVDDLPTHRPSTAWFKARMPHRLIGVVGDGGGEDLPSRSMALLRTLIFTNPQPDIPDERVRVRRVVPRVVVQGSTVAHSCGMGLVGGVVMACNPPYPHPKIASHSRSEAPPPPPLPPPLRLLSPSVVLLPSTPRVQPPPTPVLLPFLSHAHRNALPTQNASDC